MTKAAVLGSGSWGTAFAKVLAEAGTDVTMWARRAELAEAISDRHENPDFAPTDDFGDQRSGACSRRRRHRCPRRTVSVAPGQSHRMD